MTYNITLFSSSESISEIVAVSNTYSGNTFTGMFIVAVFFIQLMVLKRWGFEDALAASSFSTFVLSIFLVNAELLNPLYTITFFIIMVFTTLYIYMNRRK